MCLFVAYSLQVISISIPLTLTKEKDLGRTYFV
jgi:hypothetical protein